MDHKSPYVDPSSPQIQVPFKISPQDQKVLDQCNKESFYLRCLPLSVGFGGVTFLAVRAGYLRGHPSWGAIPKMAGAVFCGYFLGKVSYQEICAQKLMAIPDSPIGAMLRARREKSGGGGMFQDSFSLDMPGYSMPEESPQDKYHDDISPHTFTDLDTDRPYNQGLDDSFRLNIDSPQRTEDFILPPQAATTNSYDEMRRRNREEFERKTRTFRSQPAREDVPRQYQPLQPPPPAYSEPVDRYKPTNKYGDIFEK